MFFWGGNKMVNNMLRKGLVLGIIVLFVAAGVIPSTIGVIDKKTTYKSNSERGYIQELIDNASNGDTIYIPSGTYYENIIINKSISLVGEDRNTTTIDGGGSGNVVNVSVDWVNISEFTIRNSGGNQDYSDFDAGIDIRSNYNTIICNSISNSMVCIYLKSSNNNIITGNSISGNNFSGIYLYDSRRNTITDNNISDNFFGIHHLKSSNNIIMGNSISNNWEGIYFESSSSNNITSNKFTSNRGSITFWGSSSNIIISNDILNSGEGIWLVVLSNKNIIEKNNFIGNKIHAIFYISWRNNWDGNYWDNWIGFGPKPIFGFLGINFDWHPAQEPYDIEVR